MPEPILLILGLALAGAMILPPLWRDRDAPPAGDDDRDAAAVRHRVALEALRDVEADRRAGLLDDAAHAEQLAQAEERAAVTRAALDARPAAGRGPAPAHGRTAAVAAAGAIVVLLVGGSLLPATGIGNDTTVNEPLAAAQATEAERQQRIAELRTALAADTTDPETLSALADAHLAGSSEEDLVRAAVALRLLIDLEPERPDAYERIIAAYLRAGDSLNARAAHTSYVTISAADPAEVAFLDGLIALRGENDPHAAADAFDRFLELAPDDPRAPMVRALRDEASGGG